MSTDLVNPSLPRLDGKSRIFGRNLWALYFIAAYTLSVTLLALALGRPGNIPGSIYIREWMIVPVFYLVGFMLISAVTIIRTGGSTREYTEKLHYLRSSRVLSGLVIFIALGFFHGTFTSMKAMLPHISSFTWDVLLADLDAAIHGGDPWMLLPHHQDFTRMLQFLYLPVWVSALAFVSFHVCTFADGRTRARYLKTFFFCWIFLGNVMALAFMSAGPVYFEQVTGDARFRELLDYLDFSRDMPFSNLAVADFLWASYLQGEAGKGSGISAFPSLHLAMATLWTVTFWKSRPRLGYVFLGYTVLIQVGSVHLGWHYAIDGYVSIAATLAAWWLFGGRWSAGTPDLVKAVRRN